MVILNADHPDVEEFIWCKVKEERKARVLRDAGFDMDLDGADSFSIQYQNANNSVRITDEFMQAVLEDADWALKAVTSGEVVKSIRARDLWRQIALAAWDCADPGLQFDTTINKWHTAHSTGRINGSNPCSEYMHLDNSACNLASINLLKYLDEGESFDIDAYRHTIEMVFTAQEILVGRADYPTESIAETSRQFRQLDLEFVAEPVFQTGDLVVRDLGYFVLAALRQIAQAGAFFLSRLRLDTLVYDPRTGAPLDLLGLLRRQGQLDRIVGLGAAHVSVRLVAVRLPETVAAQRRRTAKQNRDQRWQPTARHLALLGWAIFVTNVSRETWSAQTVVQVYGLRWRIETIFKAWKSHFRLTEVPHGAAAQLEAMIYARLIFVTVFAQTCAGAAAYSGNEAAPPQSLLQWAGLIGDFFLVLCLEAWRRPLQDSFFRQLAYHGRYERRRRRHFGQTLMNLS
jgi:hypothetical protein